MYKKKNRTPIYLAVAAAVALIAFILFLQFLLPDKEDKLEETETETQSETVLETENRHGILLYKPGAGTVAFDKSWLVLDSDKEAELSVETYTLVTMIVTPDKGKALVSADVLDYEMKEVEHVLRSSSGDEQSTGEEMRLSFVMPDRDLFISFNFADIKSDESEEETSEQESSPYNLTLHNLTADIIESFAGKFDEKKFLLALGDSLHVDSVGSEYQTVTDVYFGEREESDSDKISYRIYFNDDENWEVLATYYLAEDSYVFTKMREEEETQTEALNRWENEDGSGMVSAEETAAGQGTYWGSPSGSTVTSELPQTTATSLDILSVSTVFLSYVGDEDAFYQAAFDYILEKGCTGSITGTMSGYEIDPENKMATIQIMLSTGGTMTGTYDKAKNTYSFSGL